MDRCGTPQGRGVHRRAGEPMCDPCRLAWNEYTRERIKEARQRGWVRPDREPSKVKFRSADCSQCGCALTRAVLVEPLCASCRGNRPGYNIKISRAARLAIYERDGWTCQICTEAVDPAVDPNSTWGATLDHITPKARGGSDDPSNLRLAHRWCNSVRGDLRFHTDDDLRIA